MTSGMTGGSNDAAAVWGCGIPRCRARVLTPHLSACTHPCQFLSAGKAGCIFNMSIPGPVPETNHSDDSGEPFFVSVPFFRNSR